MAGERAEHWLGVAARLTDRARHAEEHALLMRAALLRIQALEQDWEMMVAVARDALAAAHAKDVQFFAAIGGEQEATIPGEVQNAAPCDDRPTGGAAA